MLKTNERTARKTKRYTLNLYNIMYELVSTKLEKNKSQYMEITPGRKGRREGGRKRGKEKKKEGNVQSPWL